MEIIKITKERMEELLPKNIKTSDVISIEAKMVLASLLNYQLLNPIAKECGFVAISNPTLSKSVGLRLEVTLGAVGELVEHKLVARISGKTRTKGSKAMASEYHILWDNLRKPLKRMTFEELYADYLKNTGIPLGTTDTESETETPTTADSESEPKSEDSESKARNIDEDMANLPF